MNLQQSMLQHFVVDCPLKSLKNALNQKRENQNKKITIFRKVLNKLKIIIS